jgi:hypothetical protein
MTVSQLLTLADMDAAIAGDEEHLADYRLDLAECEEAGLDTAQALSLVHIVEGHLALLRERRERLLQEQTGDPNAL